MEEKYYYCSKYIRFPIKNVVQKIYDLYNTTNKSFINIADIYEYLREQFNAKSFNRANLIELLGSSGDVSFNAVKDLYVKYVVETNKEESVNYDILNKVFIQNRIRVIEFINVLGLDSLKDMLSNGFLRWLVLLNQFLDKNEEANIKTNNSSLLHMFVEGYEENELLTVLQDEETITNKIESFIEITQRKTKCQQLKNNINFRLEDVHKDNLGLLVKYLFAGSVSQVLSAHNIKTVQELKDLEENILEELQSYENNIINKLKALQFSLKEKLNEDFKLLVQLANKQNKPNKLWENYVSILENRAKGKTLEASGQHLGITRERVRQLESKYFDAFNLFNQKMNSPINMLRAMVENEFFVQDSDIIQIFPFNPLLYKYFLLNANNDNLEYAEELGKFYYVDDYRWYDEAVRYAESLPEQIPEKNIDNFITELGNNLKDNGVNLSVEDCSRIILEFYKKTGDIFSKNRMNLAERYRFIWKEHFPEVVNIYDNEFLAKFKKIYSKTFADNKEYSDRSVVGILTRFGMLCGRGEYKINDRMFMSEELANKIYKYILDSGRQTFLTNTLYSIFNEDLETEGINNKYFLQGALHQRFGNKLYFRRDYVSTTPGDFNVYTEILDYVKENKKVLTYDEIKSYFEGVTDIVLWLALSQEGILWYRKKFIHADNLDLTDNDIDYLKATLTQLLSDNEIHHASQLMQYIKLSNNEILKKCYITEQFALFSVIQNLFDGEFEFKRPFIANKNIVIGNQIDRIKEYVYAKDLCTIDELLEFVYENQMHLYSILECVNSLEGYVFKDEGSLVPEEISKINQYNVSVIESLIEKELGNADFVFVDKLKSRVYFPPEVSWTDWLIYSAINRYGEKFNVIPSNNVFKNRGSVLAKPIVVKKELNITKIDELKDYLKEKMNMDETSFFVYLRNNGLA